MKAAITGATGFLGSHLARTLLERGWDVSGLAQADDKLQKLPAGIQPVTGDICDEEALARLVAASDIVFHTVSNFRTASGSPESYVRINVEGTRKTFQAALDAGCRRFIHCSTIGVHGDVKSTPATETSSFNPGDLYQETKLAAEDFIRSQISKSSMEIVIVRPCSMYGPGDLRMLKMFRMLSARTFFKLGRCRENFHAVYIDDITEGLFLAGTAEGIDGETFVIGGENYLPLDEYIDTAAAAASSPAPFLRFPYSVFFAAAWLCEKLFIPLGIEPPLHIRRVRFFRNNRAFDISKSRDLLGYRPKTDLQTGMRLTVDWYRDQGLLKRPE